MRRPAAAFLFVRVLAKQWVSQEGPRRRTAEVQRRFEGYGTEEAAGAGGGGASCRPQLSCPCPDWRRGSSQVRRSLRTKG